ncbi:hypothetical protein CesoFtcFv8_012879 [Champsocephalus esox]|uniref:Uncharacterized protein n=1 Tax=Champsocephalus esox TaxID=159716 RepID=A0AAN8GYB0_9TELE|nr:hypothetical protein CesoFtcFv8_012879 [Champsocephalus esox]
MPKRNGLIVFPSASLFLAGAPRSAVQNKGNESLVPQMPEEEEKKLGSWRMRDEESYSDVAEEGEEEKRKREVDG